MVMLRLHFNAGTRKLVQGLAIFLQRTVHRWQLPNATSKWCVTASISSCVTFTGRQRIQGSGVAGFVSPQQPFDFLQCVITRQVQCERPFLWAAISTLKNTFGMGVIGLTFTA